MRAVVALTVGAGLIVHVGAGSSFASQTSVEATPTLVDLRSVGDLQQQFNADRDCDRLVLLLSPT